MCPHLRRKVKKVDTRSIKLVAFDCDGVIVETLKEWYLLALEAFNQMEGGLSSTGEVEKCFRQARAFLKNAEDSYFVLKAIKDNEIDFSAISQKEFNQRARPFFENEGKIIAQKIYARRKELREHDKESWITLFSIFPAMKSVLKKVMDRYVVVIATTRDRASVSAILELGGIPIKNHRIIGRDFSIDKREQMKFIAQQNSVSLSEIFFIDDILEHVNVVSSLGVTAALASWGYSNPQQLSEARDRGIFILSSPGDILQHLGL
jgi:phosphoglycolate phosphatase-like HAD superfamily hydrolase